MSDLVEELEDKPKRKGKYVGAAKINDEQRLTILRMCGEGMKLREISKYAKEEWNIDYSISAIHQMAKAKRHQPHLKKFRDDYLKRIKDVPIANKRTRIDDLEKVRVKIMNLIDENKCETKAQKDEFRNFTRTLNDVIINAREEMEKKPQLISGLGLVGDFSDKSDDDLIRERDEILKQADRLIAGRTPENSGDSEGIKAEDFPEPA